MNARKNDPATSKAAAWKKSDNHTSIYVNMVMMNGVRFTDERLFKDLRKRGYAFTPDRIRHGRKFLSDRGLLVEVGKERTSNGGMARVWQWHTFAKKGGCK